MDARKAIGEKFTRQMRFNRQAVDEKARQVQVAFSSETESVERVFGVEILDHSKNAVQLARLNNAGPVLMNHRPEEHVGVVERAWVDQKDRVARAVLRFGQSSRAKEIFTDIVDGILTHSSVGYLVNEMVREKTSDNGPDRYRVTSWTPLEISMVAVPADASVGVGRNYQKSNKEFYTMNRRDEEQILTEQEQKEQDEIMGRQWTPAEKERFRSSQILEMAKLFPDKQWARELGESYIRNGRSLHQFQRALQESLRDRPQPFPLAHDIGLDTRDLHGYSLMRLIQSVMTGQPDRAGYEMEVGRHLEKQFGRAPQGTLIPWHGLMSQRLIQKGDTQSGTSLIGTTHRGDLFIDVLRNSSLIVKLGARLLPDLQGDVSIPKKTTASIGSWVAEDTAASQSSLVFGNVGLAPKSISSWAAYTRKMLLQSSPSIEQLVMDDLTAGLGLGIDRAVIAGSGQGAEPLGILGQQGLEIVSLGDQGGAPTWEKIVELESRVSADNADIGSLAYLTNSKVRGKLKVTEKFADTNGQAIWPDVPMVDNLGTLNTYRAGVSNQVPSNLTKGTTGTGLSAILFGNWADVLLGQWSGVYDLVIDPYSESKKGNTIITAFSDVDVALRNVQSFAAIVDCVTTV